MEGGKYHLSSKDLDCNPVYKPQWNFRFKTEKQPAVTKQHKESN